MAEHGPSIEYSRLKYHREHERGYDIYPAKHHNALHYTAFLGNRHEAAPVNTAFLGVRHDAKLKQKRPGKKLSAPSAHDSPMTKTELREYVIEQQARHIDQIESDLNGLRARMRGACKHAMGYEDFLASIASEMDQALRPPPPGHMTHFDRVLKGLRERVNKYRKDYSTHKGYGDEDIPPHPWNDPGPREVFYHHPDDLANIELLASPTWHPILSPGNQVLSPVWSPSAEDVYEAARSDPDVRKANNRALNRGELSPDQREHLKRVTKHRPRILGNGVYPTIDWDDQAPQVPQRSVLKTWENRFDEPNHKYHRKRSAGAHTDEDDSDGDDDDGDFGPFTRNEHNQGVRFLNASPIQVHFPPITPSPEASPVGNGLSVGSMLWPRRTSEATPEDTPSREASPVARSPSLGSMPWLRPMPEDSPVVDAIAEDFARAFAPEAVHASVERQNPFLAVGPPLPPSNRRLPPPSLRAASLESTIGSRNQAPALPTPTLAPIRGGPAPIAGLQTVPPFHTLLLEPAFQYIPRAPVRQHNVRLRPALFVDTQGATRTTVVTVDYTDPSLRSAPMSISSGGSPEPTDDDNVQQAGNGTAAANPPPAAAAQPAANNAPAPAAPAQRGRKRKAAAMLPYDKGRLRQKRRVNYQQ